MTFEYNVNKNTIEQDGKFVAYVNCVDGFRIANKLTVLAEENEQLKQQLEDCIDVNTQCCNDYSAMRRDVLKYKEENEQLKQFQVKLDNRIQKLEESLKALREMEDDDLNPQAVEDVATVIAMSLNALLEFKKELKGDVE